MAWDGTKATDAGAGGVSPETETKNHPTSLLEHAENGSNDLQNSAFDADAEPELHARTYIALAAMVLLNYIQVLALQGPPAVVCHATSDIYSKWIDLVD